MSDIKSHIARIKQSKDGKVIVSNFTYLTILQIVGYIFPFISTPYLSRVIGADGFGKIAFASAIVLWLQTIVDWGFNYTATRDVAQNRDNKYKVSDIFSNVLWAKCLLMLISFVILVILILCIPKFKEQADVILVTFLMIPGYILFPDWFFQALERMKYITILNFAIKLFFTLAVFIFIKQKSDYILQPLFISLGFIISGLIAMYFIVVRWKINIRKPNPRAILQTIKGSTDIFINNLAPNLYNSLAVVLLGIWHGDTCTGIYNAGKMFMTAAYKFLNMLPRAFFPFLARRIDKHSFFAKIYISVSAICAVLLFVFAPLLIRIFFGSDFMDAVNVLRIVSIALIFLALESTYGTNYLLLVKEDHLLRNITLISSILACIIGLPLVYYFNYIGVAITYLIANILLGTISMFFSKKHQRQQSIKI